MSHSLSPRDPHTARSRYGSTVVYGGTSTIMQLRRRIVPTPEHPNPSAAASNPVAAWLELPGHMAHGHMACIFG